MAERLDPSIRSWFYQTESGLAVWLYRRTAHVDELLGPDGAPQQASQPFETQGVMRSIQMRMAGSLALRAVEAMVPRHESLVLPGDHGDSRGLRSFRYAGNPIRMGMRYTMNMDSEAAKLDLFFGATPPYYYADILTDAVGAVFAKSLAGQPQTIVEVYRSIGTAPNTHMGDRLVPKPR